MKHSKDVFIRKGIIELPEKDYLIRLDTLDFKIVDNQKLSKFDIFKEISNLKEVLDSFRGPNDSLYYYDFKATISHNYWFSEIVISNDLCCKAFIKKLSTQQATVFHQVIPASKFCVGPSKQLNGV